MKKSLVVLVSLGLLPMFTGCAKQPASANPVVRVTEEGMSVSPPKAAIPAALVGTWRNGNITTVDFYNAKTGEWKNGEGQGMFLTIQPNGEYRIGAVEPVYLNNAEARYQLYQQGKVAMAGSQMVLYPASGYTEVREAGAPLRNMGPQAGQNELQASAFAFKVVPEHNVPYRPKLVLTTETGDRITLGLDGL